jgi:hypothetical protein
MLGATPANLAQQTFSLDLNHQNQNVMINHDRTLSQLAFLLGNKIPTAASPNII